VNRRWSGREARAVSRCGADLPRAKCPRSAREEAFCFDWAFWATTRRQVGRALAGADDKKGDGLASAWRKAEPILGGVYQMLAALGLCMLGGWWLDKKLGWTPWLLVAGAVVGGGAGMTLFVRTALLAGRKRPPPGTGS